MKTAGIAIIAAATLIAGAASAADQEAKERLRNELTAGIPAGGIHALHDIRMALAEELPAGLPLRQQLDQLRAVAAAARKSSDKI